MANESKVKNFLFGTQDVKGLIPGFILAAIITAIAVYLHDLVGVLFHLKKSPISSIMIAIILGLIVRNTIRIPESLYPGIGFCLAKMLRLGIILVGIRLSIFAVLKLGMLAVGIVFICICVGCLFTIFVALKLNLPERLGTLIAVGTGICGATAIVATGPSINAKEEEIAYAVGTITFFGLVVMFVYPYLTHLVLGMTHIQSGIFMGTAIHETAQVAGAGLMYDQLWITKGVHPTGMDAAIVTKLVRNTFMALVIPAAAYFYTKRQMAEKTEISIVKLLMSCYKNLPVLPFRRGTISYSLSPLHYWRGWWRGKQFLFKPAWSAGSEPQRSMKIYKAWSGRRGFSWNHLLEGHRFPLP